MEEDGALQAIADPHALEAAIEAKRAAIQRAEARCATLRSDLQALLAMRQHASGSSSGDGATSSSSGSSGLLFGSSGGNGGLSLGIGAAGGSSSSSSSGSMLMMGGVGLGLSDAAAEGSAAAVSSSVAVAAAAAAAMAALSAGDEDNAGAGAAAGAGEAAGAAAGEAPPRKRKFRELVGLAPTLEAAHTGRANCPACASGACRSICGFKWADEEIAAGGIHSSASAAAASRGKRSIVPFNYDTHTGRARATVPDTPAIQELHDFTLTCPGCQPGASESMCGLKLHSGGVFKEFIVVTANRRCL